ncbi:MAG: D-aminoacyl-tRNA deacylase [Chloroflexota bacterium]|nr:D-aminoacyl-tRNA deacylase [Chloroflexota bacterium]
MKALLQRVSQARVTMGDDVVGSISRGIVVLLGVANGDTERDIEYLIHKIINMRIFPDENQRFHLSLRDIRGEVLIVSQFTLMAQTRKGNRPSFNEAAPPQEAEPLFERFIERFHDTGLVVERGVFQQHLVVEIHNDGPVTILLNSRE